MIEGSENYKDRVRELIPKAYLSIKSKEIGAGVDSEQLFQIRVPFLIFFSKSLCTFQYTEEDAWAEAFFRIHMGKNR